MFRCLSSLLALLLIPALSLLAQTAAEEEAVKNVLTAVTQAAVRQSWAEVAQTSFVLDDKTVLLFSHADGQLDQLGKDDLLKSTAVPTAGVTSTLANIKIVVIGDAASASFDETRVEPNGQRTLLHVMWYLEKKDGVWKVHVLSYHTVSATK
jgi:hypothetical protein